MAQIKIKNQFLYVIQQYDNEKENATDSPIYIFINHEKYF